MYVSVCLCMYVRPTPGLCTHLFCLACSRHLIIIIMTHTFTLPNTYTHLHPHRLIHQQKFEAKCHDETHDSVGDYIKSMIFGGLDGILTSFAIVAGAAGGQLPVQVVLVLGFSNIFADAFSMGMGEYLSSKAHNEFVLKEREREAWYVCIYVWMCVCRSEEGRRGKCRKEGRKDSRVNRAEF